jgi:hypothetical protein
VSKAHVCVLLATISVASTGSGTPTGVAEDAGASTPNSFLPFVPQQRTSPPAMAQAWPPPAAIRLAAAQPVDVFSKGGSQT